VHDHGRNGGVATGLRTGPGNEAVAVSLWRSAPLPSGFRRQWHEELHSLSELAALRTRLRATLTGSPTVIDLQREHWSERLVLIADELASNALRHGEPPVRTVLSSAGRQWLLTVSDASLEVPPAPAQGRDPGLGGFGLYLVADLSLRHGWCREPGAKTVWAVVEADQD
jgi:signal transduction histidine kinase